MWAIQNHSSSVCPSTRLFSPSFCFAFLFPSSQATLLSCTVQDRCLVFQSAKNKASSWLFYFKQGRPPTAPNMPTERKNKWPSSSPDTYVQSICEEELLGNKHSHPTQVLPSDGSASISTYSSGEWCGECTGTMGNHKSPLPKQEQGSIQQARPVQVLKKVNLGSFHHRGAGSLASQEAKASSALLAHGHNIQQRSQHHPEPADF